MSSGINKATNTSSAQFDDLADNDTEVQWAVLTSRKIRSKLPKDTDSLASSNSKQSKGNKMNFLSIKGSKQGREDDHLSSHLPIKKSLESLSEEDSPPKKKSTAKGKKQSLSPSKPTPYPTTDKLTSRSPQKGKHEEERSPVSQFTKSFDIVEHGGDEMKTQKTDKLEVFKEANSANNSGILKLSQTERYSEGSIKKKMGEAKKEGRIPQETKEESKEESEIKISQVKNPEKKREWGVNPGKRHTHIDRLTISILKPLVIRPKVTGTRQESTSIPTNRKADDFKELKSWKAKNSTEELDSKHSSTLFKNSTLKKNTENLIFTEKSNQQEKKNLMVAESRNGSLTNTAKTFKESNNDVPNKFKRVNRQITKTTHQSTEKTWTTKEANQNKKHIPKNRQETSEWNVERKVPQEGEEASILQSAQENLFTENSWNKQVSGKDLLRSSMRNAIKTRTNHGSLPKTHIGIEDSKTKAPIKYIDPHEKYAPPPKSFIDNMIDHKIRTFDQKRRTQVKKDFIISEQSEEKEKDHKNKRSLETSVHRIENENNRWEEQLIKPTGILCSLF